MKELTRNELCVFTFNMKNKTFQRGFSLIEVITVVSIIAILAAIGGHVFQSLRSKAVGEKTKTQLHLIANALEEYQSDTGSYPEMNAIFRALSGNEPEGNQKVYLADLDPVRNPQGLVTGTDPDYVLTDPYGNEIVYRPRGEFYDLCSSGPDGQIGTADDICL